MMKATLKKVGVGIRHWCTCINTQAHAHTHSPADLPAPAATHSSTTHKQKVPEHDTEIPERTVRGGPGVLRTAGTWIAVDYVLLCATSCLEEHLAQISGFSESSRSIQKWDLCEKQEFW